MQLQNNNQWMQFEFPFVEKIASSQEIKKSPGLI